MPRWMWIGLAIVAGLFAIDRLLLWCESRGWLYWRRSNVRASGALSGALQDLQATLDPGVRAGREVQEEEKVQRDDSGDPPVPLCMAPGEAERSSLPIRSERVPPLPPRAQPGGDPEPEHKLPG